MRRLSELRSTVETWRTAEQQACDLIELMDLASAEDDDSIDEDAASS